jgi:hypothetical protein
MPSLSRFLRGFWLNINRKNGLILDGEEIYWSGFYRDYKGCCHERTVVRKQEVWRLIDKVENFSRIAVLRWRILKADWKIEFFKCFSSVGEIKVISNVPIKRFEIVPGWESRYYFHKFKIDVLEVEVEAPKATLISEIRLNVEKT